LKLKLKVEIELRRLLVQQPPSAFGLRPPNGKFNFNCQFQLQINDFAVLVPAPGSPTWTFAASSLQYSAQNMCMARMMTVPQAWMPGFQYSFEEHCMSHITLRRAQLLLVLLVPACGQPRDEARDARYEAPPAQVPAPAPAPTMAAPVITTVLVDSVVAVHLDAAHENFLKKDMAKAGDELKLAAERLKETAGDAPEAARKDMTDAAAGLEKIEGDVRSGAVTSIESLEHRLAMASASLARYHYLKASDALMAKDRRTAGREIQASVDQLEMGAKRLGLTMSGKSASAATNTRELGRQLADGAAVAEEHIGGAMKGLGNAVESLVNKARAKM
jgi:hypothetical protein